MIDGTTIQKDKKLSICCKQKTINFFNNYHLLQPLKPLPSFTTFKTFTTLFILTLGFYFYRYLFQLIIQNIS